MYRYNFIISLLILAFTLTSCSRNYSMSSTEKICVDYLYLPSINIHQGARLAELKKRGVTSCAAYEGLVEKKRSKDSGGGGNRAMGDALQKIGRDLMNPPNTGGYTQKIGPKGNIWTCLNGICSK